MNGLLESADIFNRVINVRDLGIQPWKKDHLQPASYEMTLSSKFRLFQDQEPIDPMMLNEHTTLIDIDDNEQEWYDEGYYLLQPQQFILGSSVEVFTFPNDLAGEPTGKSSIGRLGLQVHATAGFFDPGFSGTATLEIFNLLPVPIRLYSGMIVAQMRFLTTSRPSEWAYGHPERNSRYQNQFGPTASRYGHPLPGVDWQSYERVGDSGGGGQL